MTKKSKDYIMKYGDGSLISYLAQVKTMANLKDAEEIKLIMDITKGDKNAPEQLIKSYLKIVVKIAESYNDESSLENLIKKGNIGLEAAVKNFNYMNGTHFSQFADELIRLSMMDKLAIS